MARPEAIKRARELRRQQTQAEALLWCRLRRKQLDGLKFRRQHILGPFIVDFASLERKLIIEVDGGQHNIESGHQRDQERTAWLEAQGYRVIRFWNNDVLASPDGVLEIIRQALMTPP